MRVMSRKAAKYAEEGALLKPKPKLKPHCRQYTAQSHFWHKPPIPLRTLRLCESKKDEN